MGTTQFLTQDLKTLNKNALIWGHFLYTLQGIAFNPREEPFRRVQRRRSKSSNFKLEELKHLDAVGADGKPCRNSNRVLEEKS